MKLIVFFGAIDFWIDIFYLGEWTSIWDAIADVESISRNVVGWSSTTNSLFRSSEERILFRSKPSLFWCHSLLLPEWRQITETSQRPTWRFLWRNQILRTRRNGHQQIQVFQFNSIQLIYIFFRLNLYVFQGGRRFHQRGGETSSGEGMEAQSVALVRVPGEFSSSPCCGNHFSGGHFVVYCHLLPGDITRVQTLQVVQCNQQPNADRRGWSARFHRPFLPHWNYMHSVVYVRDHCANHLLSQSA